jgi:L,D-transpeptidase YcbB
MPYFFRQSTGPGNALGVLKFNLRNPYSIFLHATSQPEAFKKKYRFLSHGCIRLEKPFELASELVKNKINIKELKSGIAGTKSNIIMLPSKIATFLVYMPVIVKNDKVVFLKDIYNIIN